MDDLIDPDLPKSVGLLSNTEVLLGSPVASIDRLRIISDSDFEDVVREWIAGYCKAQYSKVRRASGSGDKGRDVVAFIDDKRWDNYQCKHYGSPLMPSQIWVELGKVCYYTFNKDYTLPQKYLFVSPQGIGPSLAEYFDKPENLKKELLKEWDNKCKSHISSKEVELTDELKKYIESLDFSIFNALDPQTFIEQHKQTNYFATRFGGGLNNRPRPSAPPTDVTTKEVRYVTQLFNAYGEHKGSAIGTIDDLKVHTELHGHFNRQRENFYWAEALEQFSRDSLPAGNTCFTDLKDEIYSGVIDVLDEPHADGFARVKKVTQEASKITLQSNALISIVQTQDKMGICHHLANEDRLTWVKK